MKTSSRYRWFVVVVFFIFMLLHQSDRLLIGPLTEQIKADFKINDTLMGTVSTGALIIGAVLYLSGVIYTTVMSVRSLWLQLPLSGDQPLS